MKINYGNMINQIAMKYSDKIAIYNVERKRSFTFMELHLLTNKISNLIKIRFNLKSGDVFACLLKNDNFIFFSYFTEKNEATKTWLNYREPFDEHMTLIDLVEPKLMFIENEKIDKYYQALRFRKIEIVCMDKQEDIPEGVHCFWDLIDESSANEVGVQYELDEHISDYRFTGGTTGKSKCCMYTMQNFLSGVYQFFTHPQHSCEENTRFLHLTPVTHGSSLFVLPIYFSGGTQYTINSPDLNIFCETVQNEKISSTFVVPTLLYRLLDIKMEEKYDLSSLNTVYYAGSPMDPNKLELLRKKFGNIFMQLYGSSEAVPQLLLLDKTDHDIKTEDDIKRLSSCGRPLVGVHVKIADENGKEVPAGSRGEILIRSLSVIKGYFKDEEETAKAFTEDHFWRSGDVGYMDEKGYIYIVDRVKDMIVSGGFNIYANEVENVLRSHPAVEQSVVVGVPNNEWGEAVHAEVTLRDNMTISEVDLINYCKQYLSGFKVPKSITFVDEFPVSVAGKILKRLVKEKYWKGCVRQVG